MPARHAVLLSSTNKPTFILRTLFQVPYPVNPVFATLTQTPGVWGYSSHSGTYLSGAGDSIPAVSAFQGLQPDYCQLITDLSTDLPRPCRGHCHPCLKSFSCNTYGSPANVANKRLTAWLNSLDATLTKNRGGASAPRRSDFSTFRCAVCIPGGVTGRGRSDVATCFRVASLPRTLSGSLPSQPSLVLSFGRNLELTTYD